MDPKGELPEIKVEVNKESQENKDEGKKGGFFSSLLGGSAQGGGGFGGLADVGASAGGGGLLATKAGMLALILVGTTVAGSVGLLGYRFLGPGQDDQNGDNYQVFAPKPKAAPNANGAAAAAKDGSSQSLSMFAQANADQSKPAGGGDQAPQDQAAASAASGSASSGGATGSINGAADGGTSAGKRLTNSAKFGQMGSSFGGAGGGGSAGGAGAPKAGIAAASGGGGGSLGGSSHGLVGARTSVGSVGGMNRASGALGQGFGVLRDNRGATSSFGAGRTYDGSATNTGGVIGGHGSDIGGDGVGAGAGVGQGKSSPNTALPSSKIAPPPAAPVTQVVPWQGDITTCEMLIGVALLLLMFKKQLAKMINPYSQAVLTAISAVIGLIGVMVIALGVAMCTGKYAQGLQGGMLIAAGAGICLAATMSGLSDKADAQPAASGSGTPASGAAPAGGAAPASGMPVSNTVGSAFTIIGGGVALLGLAGAMMVPPKSYSSSDFNNTNPPPGQSPFSFSMREFPSQQALRLRGLA